MPSFKSQGKGLHFILSVIKEDFKISTIFFLFLSDQYSISKGSVEYRLTRKNSMRVGEIN